jgi:hypothetical protein
MECNSFLQLSCDSFAVFLALTVCILQASYNPVAYIGNPRLGTALQLLQTTDFVESKLEEVIHSCYALRT